VARAIVILCGCPCTFWRGQAALPAVACVAKAEARSRSGEA